MESRQKSPGMKNSAAIIKGLKTPTEQNLAAMLLVSMVGKKPKRKRKEKSA